MKHAVNALNQQALRAFHHLLSLFYRVKMEVKTKLTMFNLVVLFCFTVQIKLMKGKAVRKHSLHEKTAASVLLKLFISGNE